MRAIDARCFRDSLGCVFLALCIVAPAAMANQIIPAGGRTMLNDGLVNLACTDLTVGGLLDTGTGTYINARNVTVGSSGVIQGTGTIMYSGTLSVSGTVQASVKLVVNSPLNVDCPGPQAPGKVVDPAPTLGNSMFFALATLLLLLARSALRGHVAPQRRGDPSGASE